MGRVIGRALSALSRAIVQRALPGVSFSGPDPSQYASAQAWIRGLMGASGAMTEPYRQSAPLATAFDIISGDAASIEWEPWNSRDDDEPLESHPVIDLLARPSPHMTGMQLWVGTYLSHLIFGEAFWYYPDVRVNGRTGVDVLDRRRDAGIALLDPRRVRHRAALDGDVVQWSLVVRGDEVPLNTKRLTQFKRHNPYDSVRGLSKVEAIIREIAGDYAAAAWNERFFDERNGIPSGILVPGSVLQQGDLGRDQRMELLRTWNQKHGMKRSVGIMPGPGWEWIDLSVSQRDMDFKALREYSREQILAMCGVPPFYAGVLDKANYANAREQKEVYWNGTIKRFLSGVGDTLNNDFLPKLGQNVLLFPSWEEVNALTENYNEKLDAAGKLFTMGVPLRVINERLDLGLDADEIPTADQGFLPFSLAPAESVSEPRTPAGPIEEPEAAPKSLTGTRESRRALVWRTLVLRTRDIEDSFRRVLRSHFQDMGDDVASQLDPVRGMALIGKETNVELIRIGSPALDKALQRRTAPLHKQAIRRGGDSVIADLDIATTFDLQSPRVVARLAEMTAKIVRVNRTMEEALRAALIEGVQERDTLEQLRDRVQDVVREASRGRALTIARTETGTAFNGGRNLAMRQAGIERHEWLSSRDPDVRESHVEVDGEVVSIGEQFSNGLAYPQDGSGPPEEVINCRCVALPVVG